MKEDHRNEQIGWLRQEVNDKEWQSCKIIIVIHGIQRMANDKLFLDVN